MRAQITMIKAIAQSFKPALTVSRKPYVVSVGVDRFGNAIPQAKSAPLENGEGESRIVRQQDVLIYPSRKRKRTTNMGKNAGGAFKTLMAFTPSLLARLRPWRMPAANKKNATGGSLLPVVRQRPIDEYPPAARIDEPLECEFRECKEFKEFRRLPLEANEPDDRLEPRIYELSQELPTPPVSQSKNRAQVLPLAMIVALVVVYLLYVMTGMQGSMMAMSGNINTMATDTRTISQNMQAMNQSVHDMNHNVAEMNQKVGTLAKSAAPMGEAVSAVSPITKMFKSFFPF